MNTVPGACGGKACVSCGQLCADCSSLALTSINCTLPPNIEILYVPQALFVTGACCSRRQVDFIYMLGRQAPHDDHTRSPACILLAHLRIRSHHPTFDADLLQGATRQCYHLARLWLPLWLSRPSVHVCGNMLLARQPATTCACCCSYQGSSSDVVSNSDVTSNQITSVDPSFLDSVPLLEILYVPTE